MWQDLSLHWQSALNQAWIACCAGSLPIGAAIVSPDAEVIAEGRNRVYDVAEDGDPQQLRQHFMAHAEQNAFISLGGWRRENTHTKDMLAQYTLYTTLEPCDMCLGTLIQSGIKRVSFLVPDPLGGAVDTLSTTPHVREKSILAQGPEPGEAANIVLAWLIATMAQAEVTLSDDAFPLPQSFLPGFRLGNLLAESNELNHLCASQMPVSSVYDLLAAQLPALHDAG